jgi:hypothetical protein
METKDHIRTILNNTFDIISETYKYQKEDCHFAPVGKSRLIFPKKSDGTIRVSEQELRFIFVEQLNEHVRENWDVYYSVETPTEYNYRFSGASAPECHGVEADGRSANIDLSIHNNQGERIALIEFKHGHDFDAMNKDFLKLAKEKGDSLRFFVGLLSSSAQVTIDSIDEKIKTSALDRNTEFIYYSLDHAKKGPKIIFGEDFLKNK